MEWFLYACAVLLLVVFEPPNSTPNLRLFHSQNLVFISESASLHIEQINKSVVVLKTSLKLPSSDAEIFPMRLLDENKIKMARKPGKKKKENPVGSTGEGKR